MMRDSYIIAVLKWNLYTTYKNTSRSCFTNVVYNLIIIFSNGKYNIYELVKVDIYDVIRLTRGEKRITIVCHKLVCSCAIALMRGTPKPKKNKKRRLRKGGGTPCARRLIKGDSN